MANALRDTTSNTIAAISGISRRQMILPAQLLMTSIVATIGFCHGVISGGVSPGFSARRSAISSSVMSSSPGFTSSAMADPPLATG